MKESDIQKAVIDYCNKRGYIALASGGGIYLNDYATVSFLQKQGVIKKGFPDLVIFKPNSKVKLLELKTSTGKLSKDQRNMIDSLNNMGYSVDVCYGFKEAIEFIEKGEE